MRIISPVLLLSLLLPVAWASASPCALAQSPQDMMPAESAAKAKEILGQAIQAMGGNAYLNIRDVTCEGRLSQFGHAGELNGFEVMGRELRVALAKPRGSDRSIERAVQE